MTSKLCTTLTHILLLFLILFLICVAIFPGIFDPIFHSYNSPFDTSDDLPDSVYKSGNKHPSYHQKSSSSFSNFIDSDTTCPVGYLNSAGQCMRRISFPSSIDKTIIRTEDVTCQSLYDQVCYHHDNDQLLKNSDEPSKFPKKHASLDHLYIQARNEADELMNHVISDSRDHPNNPIRIAYDSCIAESTVTTDQLLTQSKTYENIASRIVSMKNRKDLNLVLNDLYKEGALLPFYFTLCENTQKDANASSKKNMQHCLRHRHVAVPSENFLTDMRNLVYRVFPEWSSKSCLSIINSINKFHSSSSFSSSSSHKNSITEDINRHAQQKKLSELSKNGIDYEYLYSRFILNPSKRSETPNNHILVKQEDFFPFLSDLLIDNIQEATKHYLLYVATVHTLGYELVSYKEKIITGTSSLFHHSQIYSENDSSVLRIKNKGSEEYCRKILRVLFHLYIDSEMSVSTFSPGSTTVERIQSIFDSAQNQMSNTIKQMSESVGLGENTVSCLSKRVESTRLVLGTNNNNRSLLMKRLYGVKYRNFREGIWLIRKEINEIQIKKMTQYVNQPADANWFLMSDEMIPQMIPSAFYVQNLNTMFITAAMTKPPLFSIKYDMDSCVSGLGFVIAHELAHACDSKALRKTKDWCEEIYSYGGDIETLPSDIMKIENKLACVSTVFQDDMRDQWNAFVPAAKMMDEVFADIMGINAISHLANDKSVFLQSFAQSQCYPMSKDDAEAMASTHLHAFPMNRVDCTAAISDHGNPSQSIFSRCKESSRMKTIRNRISKCNLFN